MKAIIIAAGRGKRLGTHTDEVPKTLVPVGARTMLGWQMRAFAGAGIDELVIIRGYRGDVLEYVISSHITLKLSSGESKRIAWDEIDQVSPPKAKAPAAAPSPSPAPPPCCRRCAQPPRHANWSC